MNDNFIAALSELSWSDLENQERPIFLYDLSQIGTTVKKIRMAAKALNQDARLFYSLKCNPHLPIVQRMADLVDGFDVSSDAELRFRGEIGIPGHRISISGPGKTDDLLRRSSRVDVGVVHIDSLQELAVAGEVGCRNISYRILLDEVSSRKLGMTTADCRTAYTAWKGRAVGLHAYLGRESFSWDRLRSTLATMQVLVEEHPEAYSDQLRFFVGPGFDIELEAIGLPSFTTPIPIDFEVGRALMASVGVYACRVLAVKTVGRGLRQIIVNGGLQHLASPFVSLSRPRQVAGVQAIRGGKVLNGERAEFVVSGSLCLGHDVLHPRVEISDQVERGDWLLFSNAGAYGFTAGVPCFIGQDLPREFTFSDQSEIVETTNSAFLMYHSGFGDFR